MTRPMMSNATPEQALLFAQLLADAEWGDGDAACVLGDLYREGRGGLRVSPRKTFHWYSRSALAGDANGQNNLGACYQHGFGCRQSYAKAVKWYRLAAAQEFGTASMNLGCCYDFGHGVPVDEAKAIALFRKAVEQGEEKGREELERLGMKVEEPKPSCRTRRKVVFVDETEKLAGNVIGIIGGIRPDQENAASDRADDQGGELGEG